MGNTNANTRAEVVAALVTDKYSGFTIGDEAMLEGCSDARLEDFRAASEARRTEANSKTRLETDNRNISARLKVAEERLKASEQPLTEEEFLAKAPARFKDLIDAATAQEAAERLAYVNQLKDLGAHTEDELKKKGLDELKTLAAYARIKIDRKSTRL